MAISVMTTVTPKPNTFSCTATIYPSAGGIAHSPSPNWALALALNLACVLQARQHAERDQLPWLSFWTVDNRPLTATDLKQAHQQWPDLSAAWRAIEAAYPPLWHGWHCRLLARYRVQWICVWDEAQNALQQARLQADAWFLGWLQTENECSHVVARHSSIHHQTIFSWGNPQYLHRCRRPSAGVYRTGWRGHEAAGVWWQAR